MIPWTAIGPLAAMSSAISRALSRAAPSSTTWPISPKRSASSAVRGRPVVRTSIATVYGIWRTSRTAEPPSGYRPQRASETPNFAERPATRMSVPCRISVPPAMAGPSTAAMSGLLSRRPLSRAGSFVRSQPPPANLSPGASEFMALRSAPAQKNPPAPVRMHARMSGSVSTRSQAASIPRIIGPDRAFLASGRFMVTIRTCPRRSVSRCWSSGVAALVIFYLLEDFFMPGSM